MARQRSLVLAAGSLGLLLVGNASPAGAQIPAAPGSSPRDEDPGKAREVVPLPPIPEHMAVPTETVSAEDGGVPTPTFEPSPIPTLTPTPRASKKKKPSPRPTGKVEQLRTL